jgi:hypothetical protein
VQVRASLVLLNTAVTLPSTEYFLAVQGHIGLGNLEGEEEFKLMFDAGDAYSMDGKQNQWAACCNNFFLPFTALQLSIQ